MGCSSAVVQRSVSEEILPNSGGGKDALTAKALNPIIVLKFPNKTLISPVS